MKKLVFCVVVISILIFSWMAVSGAPVYVAILDSPVDYHHTKISPILAEGLLKNTSVTDADGTERTWYEVNEEARKEIEKRLDRGQYAEQVRFLNALSSLDNTTRDKKERSEMWSAYLGGVLKYIFSRSFRRSVDLVASYTHGTHVAGILVESLTNVQLITFPVHQVSEHLKVSEIIKFDIESQRKEVRTLMDNISNTLKEANVRVVNVSLGSSEEIAFNSIKKKTSFLQRVILRSKLKKMAKEGAELFISELTRLVKQNPQSVFVLAAGNERKNLSRPGGHTAKIEAPNVVKVASIDDKGKIAQSSNHSSGVVDIAARGVGVESALIGGGRLRMSGTSMAAPNVGNAIAKIFETNPNLSAEAAISHLFNENSTKKTELANFVTNGRLLNVPNDLEVDQTRSYEFEIDITNETAKNVEKLFLRKGTAAAEQMVLKGLDQLEIGLRQDGVFIGVLKLSMTNKATIEVSTQMFETMTPAMRCMQLFSGAAG